MNYVKERLIEIYREFSAITADVLLDYGIAEYVDDIGYHMSYGDENTIEYDSEDCQFQFYICDGEVKVAYGYKNKLTVTDTEHSIKYNGRKFLK